MGDLTDRVDRLEEVSDDHEKRLTMLESVVQANQMIILEKIGALQATMPNLWKLVFWLLGALMVIILVALGVKIGPELIKVFATP